MPDGRPAVGASEEPTQRRPSSILRDQTAPRVPTVGEDDALVVPVSDDEVDRSRLVRRAVFLIVASLLLVALAVGAALALRRSGSRQPEVRAEPGRSAPGQATEPTRAPGEVATTSAAAPAEERVEAIRPVEVTTATEADSVVTTSAAAGLTRIRIRAVPKGARITIDGEELENGSEIILEGSPRALKVTAKGYEDYRGSVLADQTKPIEIVLKKKDKAPPAPKKKPR
jgi:hypothetical protein